MLALILFITGVQSLPTKLRDVNCLHLTNDIEGQINDITHKLSSHIKYVSSFYDDIDLRMVKIVIDRHSSGEKQKETVLKVDINDCESDNKYRRYLLNDSDEIRSNLSMKNRSISGDDDDGNDDEVIYFIDYIDLKRISTGD
ncbi:uncharacterized protein LOC116778429 [Danaus plexippus]|uniref:uncharacterized protein LOC116778429 n=1 Tax=Danaus plexippus TaxID=13037 RepID=UPI002AB0AE25|nr:uncharacterized protein LOC116778429 [Danaus plexippus]